MFTVNRWVPSGFERYVQICPPAWQVSTDPRDKKYTPEDGSPPWEFFLRPVRWSKVAEERGHTIDEYTQYGDLIPHPNYEQLRPGDFCGPLEETPTGAMIDAVSDAVLSYSGEHQECIVAVWHGYGTEEIDDLHRRNATRIKGMGQQEHFVLCASLGTVFEKWRTLLPDEPVSGSSVSSLSPQAIWPTTAEWFFTVPFDHNSSFFAGPAALADALLSDERIEAYPVSLEADFRHESQKHCFLQP
ncbi:hypothetical protein [Congregibacter litoralis]|uniref:hypothetical protein n=1 Tax=Congregibacter litoralis TaxID=393662 RepID=UPI0012601C72|nr:hypothetical protein [Congregibacter litoralis]